MSRGESKRVVVVGAGVAGLVAAIRAARLGLSVTLVEAAAQTGGLLRSRLLPSGDVVDYGTHILSDSGDAEVDAEYFQLLGPERVRQLDGVRAGAVCAGRLVTDTKFWHLPSLEPGQRAQCEASLESAVDSAEEGVEWATAEELLRAQFGARVADDHLGPLLMRWQGVEPAALAPAAVALFPLQRVIAFTPEVSRRLKAAHPAWDRRIGFHAGREGSSAIKVYYPLEGIGTWAQALTDKAQALGVELLLGTKLSELTLSDGRVTSVGTASGRRLDCEALVWTLGPAALLRLAGRPLGAPPPLRAGCLVDLVFDRPVQCDDQYVVSFDPEVPFFRMTVYQNLRHVTNGRYACTIEQFLSAGDAPEALVAPLVESLRRCGLVEPGATLLSSATCPIGGGFPVLTREAVEGGRQLAAEVARELGNVFLAGKASPGEFFMNPVMARIHEQLPAFVAALP
jgi:phytoene dehydrogenase-like protein